MSNTKLAKLLGTDPHDTSPSPSRRSTNSEPTPSWLGSDYGPDEVSFNMEGQVKGGTLRALVVAAASHEGRGPASFSVEIRSTKLTLPYLSQSTATTFRRSS